MKNKKTIVMGIIIGILLIIIAVMGYVIASGKKGPLRKKRCRRLLQAQKK